MVTPIHESGHVLEYLLAGLVPDWVCCIPNGERNGVVSGGRWLFGDLNQDYDNYWKHELKIFYAGLVGAARFTGSYNYNRAAADLEQVDEIIRTHNLSEGDVLGCWLEVHRDISQDWDLIMKMSQDLAEAEILGAEYYETVLLS